MLHRERFFVWRDFVESVFVESVFVGIEAYGETPSVKRLLRGEKRSAEKTAEDKTVEERRLRGETLSVEKPFREEIISKERRAPGRTRLALNCSRTVYNLLIWLNYFL